MACPANSYKTNRGGTRRIQEHSSKVKRTYKYTHAKLYVLTDLNYLHSFTE